MSTILFDSASTRDLLSPTFAVPLIPASIHDDIPQPCEVCEVVHLPAGPCRPIHPISYWLALDVRTLGPDARREFEFWYLEGYAVGRDDREMEDQPPACLDSFQTAAWCRGYRTGVDTLHEDLRLRAEAY